MAGSIRKRNTLSRLDERRREMQTNLPFVKAHTQGRLPLGMEQTPPLLLQKKGSCAVEIQYAYSIKTSRVKEPDFPYSGYPISCTADLVRFSKALQNSDIEKMVIVYLDTQNQIICVQVVNGTVNQAVIYPREVMRHALLIGASAMILIHNHPSGNLKPSEADIRLTAAIKDAGKVFDLLVHDHLVIGSSDRYFSFREEGMI